MCDCTNNAPQANEEESELDKLLATERYVGGLEAEVVLLKEMLKEAKHSCSHYHYPTVPCQLNHYPSYVYPTWYGTTTTTHPTPGTYTITSTGI